jgi:hypothetical protein
MEGLCHSSPIRAAAKGIVVALVAFTATTIIAGSALGGRRYVTSKAHTHNHGVDFTIREVDLESGRAATSSGSGADCDYQPQFGNIGETSGYWGRSPSKTSILAHRTCTDGTDDFIWVDACDFITADVCPTTRPAVDPLVLAERVRDHLPIPNLTIASNPRRGLVGLKTWFWLEGGGQSLSDSLSAFDVRVDVQAVPVSYRWDFGDGGTMTTDSPGSPYPQRSRVTHTYERSSAAHPDGYPVSVTTVFDVRWRRNGGRWRTLAGISRTSERPYPVAESQAVNSDG